MEKLFNLNPNLIEKINSKYQEGLNGSLKTRVDITDILDIDDPLRENEQEKNDLYIEELNNVVQSLRSIDTQKLSEVIEITYQSSLEREEGRFHHYSLSILPPQDNSEVDKLYIFDENQKLTKLPKLAPAIENTNQKFYVWFDSNGSPIIWAFGNAFYDYLSLKISTFSAGQIIVYIPPYSSQHYVVSLLKTGFVDKIPIFGEIFAQSDDFASLKNLFSVIQGQKSSENFDQEKIAKEFHRYLSGSDYLQDIANKMRNHFHGGTLLVLADSSKLENSIQKSIPFKAKATYEELKRRLREDENKFADNIKSKKNSLYPLDWSENIAQEKRKELLNLIGQLTAVDGATIITKDFDLIAFGAKIESKKSEEIDSLLVSVKEPFENSEEEIVKISAFHGTRHQSAAKFVFEQDGNAFSIVVSQDGRISVIYFDKETKKVRAIRHAEYLFL